MEITAHDDLEQTVDSCGETGRKTRILLWVGPVERTIDIVEPRHREWSVWFCEFADATAIRNGSHWNLWRRGCGPIQVRDVILEMAETLGRHFSPGMSAEFAVVLPLSDVVDAP